MTTNFSSALFNAVTQVAREEALPALKARAEREGKILSLCAWCSAYIGEQDGKGVTGISSGICEKCLEAQTVSAPPCAACAAGYHDEIATEPCGCRCHSATVTEPLRSIIGGLLP